MGVGGSVWELALAGAAGGWVSVLAVDLVLGLLQQVQHLVDDGLQGAAQGLGAVRLAKRRHVHEGRAAPAQIQRGVVGVVTQVTARETRKRVGKIGYPYPYGLILCMCV